MKIQIIKTCNDCSNFDHQYYNYNHFCEKLNREIGEDNDIRYEIPKDCPLSDYKATDINEEE